MEIANRIEIGIARWFRSTCLGCAAFLVCVGAFSIVQRGDLTERVMALLVLGGSAVACVWVAMSRQRDLTLDHEGIHGRPFGLVRWSDVEDAFVRRNNLNRVLALKVGEPSAYLERLPRWRRSLWRLSQRAGFGDLSFDITGMRISSDELVRIVRARAGGKPSA